MERQIEGLAGENFVYVKGNVVGRVEDIGFNNIIVECACNNDGA